MERSYFFRRSGLAKCIGGYGGQFIHADNECISIDPEIPGGAWPDVVPWVEPVVAP